MLPQVLVMKPAVFCLTILICGGASVLAADESDVEFFETRIRPVLVRHCYECHSSAAPELQGGLRLDDRHGVQTGGDSGPVVVAGKPEESELLRALRYESFEMPPAGRLPDDVIDDFARWIQNGAVDPRDQPPTPAEAADAAWQATLHERSNWWSLQPPVPVDPPLVQDPEWQAEPVDRFVRAALDAAELTSAPPADAQSLLRRLSFVLLGLPPTPQQVESFPLAYAQDADAAVAALVDELLASPHFGERFARHWMDVVRYTDTYGYEWDNPAKGSWEYRDYLIRAFNDDVGYDQMIREQIAGDLLVPGRINAAEGVNESLIGPMFYHLGEHRHGSSLDFNGIHQEMVNNKIDAFSKAFLAMTVACARCHDHKLDAISQADYYALAGVFMSPRWSTRVVDAPGTYDPEIRELKSLRSEVHDAMARLWLSDAGRASISAERLREWVGANRMAVDMAPENDPAHPLRQIADATDESIGEVWSSLASEWEKLRTARLESNSRQFTVLADFSEPTLPAGWIIEGDGLHNGYVADGGPLVSLEGDSLIATLLPRGYHTHALSSKLPGVVRLPAQTDLPGQTVSMQLCGGEWAGYLVVPQNAFQSEQVTFFDPAAAAQWTSIADSGLSNGVTRVHVEVAASSLNPNFPPRTGLARAGATVLPNDDLGYEKRSWFSLTGIVTHDAGGSPEDTLDVFAPLYDGEPPANTKEAWQRVESWCRGSVERWAGGAATSGDVTLLNWLLQAGLLPNSAASAPEAAALVHAYREVEARIDYPRTANSMDERHVTPVDYRVNIRGNVDEEGASVQRDFLEVFAGQNDIGQTAGSGRLELAAYLSSRENPQTARVYVNRVWQWVFGTGIVSTSSDFGRLGDRPSHPELLDWLAVDFMENGWSTKTLLRKLVLSRTFRQSGDVTPVGRETDPDNRLLHHYSTRRLEAEAIRDSVLAVSGRLDPRLYGRPIKPYRSAEDSMKRLFSGPLDGDGRRSLYLEMSIMEPPKFLVGFNLPDLKLPTGRRDVTNVPAQALILLNDPFVVQACQLWADELIDDGSSSPEERIHSMFVRGLGRPPDQQELARWTGVLLADSGSNDVMADRTAWTGLAQAIFNTKEFIYYR